MKRVKNWSIDRYANHIHCHLRQKEEKMMVYQQQSPQLFVRSALVDYTIAVCDKMGFCTEVKHLAVYYLDLFMDNHVIMPEHMCLIAIGCISVAVKVDECDSLIPKMSDFNSILGNVYQLKEIIEIEGYVMRFFNWDLLIPTPATFVEYYALGAISYSDYCSGMSTLCMKEIKKCLKQYMNYFLDLSLKDYRFRIFRPSVVAASCVAASRKYLRLAPIWPYHLEEFTMHKFESISYCLELLIQLFSSSKTVPVNEQQKNPVSLKRKQSGIGENLSSAKRRGEIVV